MFCEIEIKKYYEEKFSKEGTNQKRNRLLDQKQHFGESKYREDWYNQKVIAYPRKNIFDKIKQKQELYKFRQNGDNLLKIKSSIHGSAKKVNLEQYFNPIEENLSEHDSKFNLRGSLDSSPDKYDGYNNFKSQHNFQSSPKNYTNHLPPIKPVNPFDFNSPKTSQYSHEFSNQMLQKNYSQPNFQSNYQQFQNNNSNSSMQYQQTSPTNKSTHNYSLFLTKQQNYQQSDSKINYESRNVLGSNNNGSEYTYDEENSYISQSNKKNKQYGKQSSQSLLAVPKLQMRNLRDISAPTPKKGNGNNSQYSLEIPNSSTPYGDKTNKSKRSQSNFSKLIEGGGQDDSSLVSKNVSNKSQNKIKDGKGKKISQHEPNYDQMTSVQKFDFLMASLNEIQQRFQEMVENDNELLMIFENLTTLKLVDIAKILASFFRYCMEQLIFGKNTYQKGKRQSSQMQQQSQNQEQPATKIGAVDIRNFKKLTISQGLVKPLENFFANELAAVEFHKEIAKFRLIWKEACEQHLLVHNLLLEIGGIRRMKVILQNIAEKLQKHYTVKFSNSQIEEMFVFSQAIFQDNSAVMSSSLLKYRQQLLKNKGTLNFQRVTFVDLFIIKHFVFLELVKEEYIPWESKLILLQKLEAFRFEYFRDLYNLPETKDIAAHMLNFAPQALIDQLPYKTTASITQFFVILADNMLGSGNSLQFIQTMENENFPATYNNIIMMEHLIKSSLTINKDIPQIIRKIIEHKFITLKRNLKIFTSFNSIIIKADDIINKMNTMNIILIKYLNIPKEEHKLYLDMNLFYQVLVEACSQLDAFSLQDLQYGMKQYKFEKKHYFFWIKSIKRVLLEMKYSIGDVQNLAIHLEKIYDDSTL